MIIKYTPLFNLRSVIVSLILLANMSAANAAVTAISSSLVGEGSAPSNIVIPQTDSQAATTRTLSISDSNSNATGSATATTNIAATWLNAAQGIVDFSQVDYYVGPTTVDAGARNSGRFLYNFLADINGLMTVDYAIFSTADASGLAASAFLNANLYIITLSEVGVGSSRTILGQNVTGQFTGSILAGQEYQLSIERQFFGSGSQAGSTSLLNDAHQSAKFDWSVPSASSQSTGVPETSSIYLLAFGLFGLFVAARRRI